MTVITESGKRGHNTRLPYHFPSHMGLMDRYFENPVYQTWILWQLRFHINAEPSRYSDQDKLQFSEIEFDLKFFPLVKPTCCRMLLLYRWALKLSSLFSCFQINLISCTVFHYQDDLTYYRTI